MIEFLAIAKKAIELNANAICSQWWQYFRLLNFIFTSQDIFAFAPIIFFLVLLPLGLLVFFSLRRGIKITFPDYTVLTEFHFTPTSFNKLVEETIRKNVGDYHPPWWYSSHLGTLYAFGADLQLKYQIEEVIAEDKNRFHLNYYPYKPLSPSVHTKEKLNIVVYFPGLGLTAKSKIIQKFAQHMWKDGYFTVIVDPRGLEIPLDNNRPWHPGFVDDAIYSVEYLTQLYPSNRANLFLVGYSAGTNLVQKVILHFSQSSSSAACNTHHHFHTNTFSNSNSSKHNSSNKYSTLSPSTSQNSFTLQQQQDGTSPVQIAGAMCVCINYDYLASRNRLERTILGCLYSMLMCWVCKHLLLKNAHVYDTRHLKRITQECYFMSHYDKLAGKLIHGYETEEELRIALSMQQLQRIGVPLLALQASDDPLHSGQLRENICIKEIIDNPNILYMETKYGNHFGYYEGDLFDAFTNNASYTYPAKIASQFFGTVLTNQDHQQQ